MNNFLTKAEFEEIQLNYINNRKRLKSLKLGQKVYELDSLSPNDYFEHEIIAIDVDNSFIMTEDLSRDKKISKLTSFYLLEEIIQKTSFAMI